MQNIRKAMNLIFIVFLLDCYSDRREQKQLLDMFGCQFWVFYGEHEDKIGTQRMAYEGSVVMLVEFEHENDRFDEKSIYLRELETWVVLQFATHAHSSNLPKYDVSHLNQRLNYGKFHERRPSKSMSHVVVLRLFALINTGYKHRMQNFFVADGYIPNMIFQSQMSEYFFFHIGDSSLVLVFLLFWQMIVHWHSIIGEELQFDMFQTWCSTFL